VSSNPTCARHSRQPGATDLIREFAHDVAVACGAPAAAAGSSVRTMPPGSASRPPGAENRRTRACRPCTRRAVRTLADVRNVITSSNREQFVSLLQLAAHSSSTRRHHCSTARSRVGPQRSPGEAIIPLASLAACWITARRAARRRVHRSRTGSSHHASGARLRRAFRAVMLSGTIIQPPRPCHSRVGRRIASPVTRRHDGASHLAGRPDQAFLIRATRPDRAS
jgi:hypothetical protein